MDPEPKTVNVWPAVLAFLGLLLANLGASMPFALVGMFLLAKKKGSSLLDALEPATLMERLPHLMVASLVASTTATVAVGLIAFVLTREKLAPVVLAPSRLKAPAITAAALFLTTIGYGAVSSWLAVLLGAFENSALDAFERLCLAVSPAGFAVLLVAGSVLPGFGEELLFRGFMQPRFVARWGAPAGIAITSLLFGAMHMDLMQGIFAAGMGAVAGWVTWRTGTLWPAMVAHAANNATSFILTRALGPTPPGLPSLPVAAPFLAALVVGAALLLWQNARRE